MIDINKQVAYWRVGAEEDWDVALGLVGEGKIRHGLFFAHLAVEKNLKAHICSSTGKLAPPIHNLVRLLEKTGLALEENSIDLLAEVNEFNIEGRYPEMLLPLPTKTEADLYMKRIAEVLECLNNLF